MRRVAFLWIALASTTALADDLNDTADQRWPAVPASTLPKEEDVMLDHMSDLGNLIGRHMDELSHDFIGLTMDARGQRARLRVGGGSAHYLEFKVDSDWFFSDGKARVNARVQLGLAGHEVDLKLPAMDLSQDNYHGEQMVEVNVPLLERRF